MSEPHDFRAVQRHFARHLRDPRQPPPDGIDERRLAIYRELFFNTVRGALDAAFPVLRTVLPPEVWQQLQRDFYAQHRSPYPQLHRVPEALVEYLHEARPPQPRDPPYLCDLAHYEWVELELSIAEDVAVEIEPIATAAAWLDRAPVLNPLSRVLEYRYPVHRIGPSFSPQSPQPTWLAVYRDADLAVRFIELNAPSARLLAMIEADPAQTGAQLFARLAAELPQLDREAVVAAGLRLLDDLRARGLLLGGRRGDDASAAPH